MNNMGFNRQTSKGNSKPAFGGGSRFGKQASQQPAKPKLEYFPILSVFMTEKAGRYGLDFKAHQNSKQSLYDTLTKEEFLFLMAAVYDGDYIIRGSLWDADDGINVMSGNFRLTNEDLDELREAMGGSKQKKAKAKKAPVKPVYVEPEEEEEEETYDDLEDTSVPY
jgi:hypothetical protein